MKFRVVWLRSKKFRIWRKKMKSEIWYAINEIDNSRKNI